MCPFHTGELNSAAGVDPELEEREYGHISKPSPALEQLLPADGMHVHITLPAVTALAIARILTVAPPH